MALVSKLIEEEAKILGSTTKVFIGGHSQGCLMTLATFFKYPEQLGGAVGLHAGNVAKIDFTKVDLAKKRSTPLFMYFGEADHLIPCEKTTGLLKTWFDSLQLDYTIKSEPGLGHWPLSE